MTLSYSLKVSKTKVHLGWILLLFLLQVGTVVEVLDRLSPSGPVKSTYPLTFVQLKQVRIPLLGILQLFCQVYLNIPPLYDCSYVQCITPYFSTGSNNAGKDFLDMRPFRIWQSYCFALKIFSFHECRYMLYIFVSSPAVEVRALDETLFFQEGQGPWSWGMQSIWHSLWAFYLFFLSFPFTKCLFKRRSGEGEMCYNSLPRAFSLTDKKNT